MSDALDQLCIDTIRFLPVDAVQKADSGHPARAASGKVMNADRGEMLGVERFGASAPADILLREYGFTVENVVLRARKLLAGLGDAHGP